uniref:glucuronosyltransferase n=1 Tax=Sus scrofa TaxID=9823 RepID=A0A287AW66_PIG
MNKMSLKWLSLLLLLQLTCYFSSGRCGKVLVWPMEYSHWINMKIILEELVSRGHEVTVLTSPAAVVVDVNKSSTIKFEIFPTSITKDYFDNFVKQFIEKWRHATKDSLWTHLLKIQNFFWKFSDIALKLCKDAILNKKFMTKLQESRFDVVLADPVIPCGELVAEILNIPLVYSLRFSPGYSIEKFGGKLPFPPSYVPVVMSELSDHMTFTERVKNMLYVVFLDFWFQTFNEKKWNQFYSEALGRPTTLFETMGKADMWLIRNYWDFDFPAHCYQILNLLEASIANLPNPYLRCGSRRTIQMEAQFPEECPQGPSMWLNMTGFLSFSWRSNIQCVFLSVGVDVCGGGWVGGCGCVCLNLLMHSSVDGPLGYFPWLLGIML